MNNSIPPHLNVGPIKPPTAPTPVRPTNDPGSDFAALIRDQLEQVNAMQSEAQEKVQQLVTGETDNLTDVFTAARKAEVAFSLLMEIRNKLVSAYDEVRNMRV